MRKRGKPSIPDFARQQPRRPVLEQSHRHAPPPPAAAPTRAIKPQATSAKSGRRGQ
jgi:hypothetical protein